MSAAAYGGVARWLLAHEMEHPAATTAAEAAERVAAGLSGGVASLVSQDGYRSLLKRALYLARAESNDLDGARIGTSGTYFEALDAQLREDALVRFFAHLIALLARFIGDDLTGNLIRQRWPHAPIAARGLQRRKERG